jgi:hypothetical protein
MLRGDSRIVGFEAIFGGPGLRAFDLRHPERLEVVHS